MLDMPSEELTSVSLSFFVTCVRKIITRDTFFWYLYVRDINYWLAANTIATKCPFLACICSTWLVGPNQMKWKLNNLFLTPLFFSTDNTILLNDTAATTCLLELKNQSPRKLGWKCPWKKKSPRYPQQIARAVHWSTGYGIEHNWLLSSHGATGQRARRFQSSSLTGWLRSKCSILWMDLSAGVSTGFRMSSFHTQQKHSSLCSSFYTF